MADKKKTISELSTCIRQYVFFTKTSFFFYAAVVAFDTANHLFLQMKYNVGYWWTFIIIFLFCIVSLLDFRERRHGAKSLLCYMETLVFAGTKIYYWSLHFSDYLSDSWGET